MNDFQAMSMATANELMAALADTIAAQPPDVAERLRLAIDSGLYDLVTATPDLFVIDVRGIGELSVRRIQLKPSE